jgi:acetyl-CoA C-acetyltransferase
MAGSPSERVPIIVGCAEITHRWEDGEPRLDPVGLMERAVTAAIADSGNPAVKNAVDALWILNVLSWSYADAPAMLAERLGIDPADRVYTGVGGNGPQALVNRACAALETGRRRVVVIAGGEAACSAQRAGKEGRDLGWPHLANPARIEGDERMGTSAAEFAYELMLPVQMYPLIETALRARAQRSPEAHREFLGRLCARFAAVAAGNPHAWFRTARPAEEIATPVPQNRYVGYPYTKLMNAIFAVDQAAALVLTTEAEATRLGIERERWVYPMGGGALNDVWHVTERPRLDESPAIRGAARAALEQAGLTVDEIGRFDLYSCFPSAVQLACDALGIATDDPRGLTLTGGLPYFGGPGNNYSTHAIATAVETIRRARDTTALVTALGWYATKHAVGVYGSRPGRGEWQRDLGREQAEIDATALAPPLDSYAGTLTVEAFVVRHGRDGEPRAGVLLARTPRGERVLATMDAEPRVLTDLELEELVGTRWQCRHDAASGKNFARPH